MTNQVSMLTISNSLARELRHQHNEKRNLLHEKVWASPDIIPWSAWLKRCYQSLIDEGLSDFLLLDEHQERLVWEKIIISERDSPFFPSSITASAAMDTWQIINDWNIDLSTNINNFSEETRIFFQWQEKFKLECKDKNFISLSQIPNFLSKMLEIKKFKYENRIELYGFDRVNFSQKKLFEMLQKRNVQINYFQVKKKEGEKIRFTFDDIESEVRAAASWAKIYTEKNPSKRIGVISPQLRKRKKLMERIFTEIHNPLNILPGIEEKPFFQFSIGDPISKNLLISQMLIILKLTAKIKINFKDFSRILRSPFITGNLLEWPQRALLDRIFLEHGMPQLSLTQILEKITEISNSSLAYCPILTEKIRDYKEKIDSFPEYASPALWSNYLSEAIQAIGWPGDGPHTNEQTQLIKRTRDMFSIFSTYSFIKKEMSLSEAVNKLISLCNDINFQKNNKSGIHLLGIHDAVNLNFDAIWILEMNDHNWPSPARPNPLIPYQIQRDLNIPGSSSESEFDFSKKISSKLLSSASLVIISHSINDNRQKRKISSIFEKIPHKKNLSFPIIDSLYVASIDQGEVDNLPQPEPVPPKGSPSGGTKLIEDQAACPFSAVAIHRLQALPLPNLTTSPSPLFIGIMLHELMRRIWGEIKTQSKLKELSSQSMIDLIETSYELIIKEFISQRPDIYTDTFIKLEKKRLLRLIINWLEYEKSRKVDFEILSLEKKEEIQLGKLILKIRSDRIDLIKNQGIAVIDYKSSKYSNVGDWFSDRPSGVQIPLYCIESDKNPTGAVIARINFENMKFLGFSKENQIIPDVDTFKGYGEIKNWDDLLKFWKKSFLSLADEIMSGIADISPKNENDCNVCELQSLCRFQQSDYPIMLSSKKENDN